MKNKAPKGVLALLLVLALLAATLMGCDNKGVESQPPSSGTTESSEAPIISEAPASKPESAAPQSSSELPSQPTESETDVVNPIQTDDKAFDLKFAENPIDKDYRKAIDEADAITDMIVISQEYATFWKTEADTAYKKLAALADGDAKTKLEQEQAAWAKAEPAELKKIAREHGDGTSVGTLAAAGGTFDFYRARANEMYRALYAYAPDYTYAYKPAK